jgi:hypothetical protein
MPGMSGLETSLKWKRKISGSYDYDH